MDGGIAIEEKDVLTQFHDRKTHGIDSKSDFDTAAEKCFKYYGNDQWDEEDEKSLREQGRPALTFNQCLAVVNAVSGTEITNRFEPKYLPRTVEDQSFSDMLTDTVRYVRQQGNIEQEESGAFRDCAIAGVSCTEFRQDYSTSLEGKTLVEGVPIFEVFWDPYARRPNLLDARWVARGMWMPLEEAISRWPEHRDLLKSKVDSGSGVIAGSDRVHDATRAHLYQQDYNQFYDRKRDEVLVWDYQRFNPESVVVWENPATQEPTEYSVQEFERLKRRLDERGVREPLNVRVRKRVYRRGYICGDMLLEDDVADIQTGFTYKFMTGYQRRLKGGVEWFGLVELVIDPQKWSNKMLSQMIHIINTNPKGVILGPRSAFEDPETVRDRWAEPNAVIYTEENFDLQKDIRIEQGRYPQSQERMLEIASEAIPRVVGFNPFIISNVSDLSRVATSAVRTVQRQGMTVLSVLFDALKLYREEAGRMHLEFIRQYMDEGTIVRITQPSGAQTPVPFKKDWVNRVEYDIVVDEAPTAVNAMQELWESLQQTQAMEILMNAGVLTPEIMVDIIPNIPETIRARMRRNVAQNDAIGQILQMVANGQGQEALALLEQLAAQQGGTQ